MNRASAAPSRDGPAEVEAALTQVIAQIKEIREQMKADDAAIAQIKAENAALKAETQMLRDEMRAILLNLPGIA